VANKGIEFALGLLVLVVGGALEELLFKPCGVGFPILVGFTLVVALRRSAPVAFLFAIAAGAVEDALSSLPPMTGVSFCTLAVLAVRTLQPPLSVLTLAGVAYQLWLFVWVTNLQGSVFLRFLVALPVGALTLYAVWGAVFALERATGVNEQE